MRSARFKLPLFFLALGLIWATGAVAQTQPVPTPQFDILGFIQEATLDPTVCATPPADPILAGGSMTVNGVKMIVPCNTILQMPATSMTWAQLFDPGASAAINPVPPGPIPQFPGQTGLALSDLPTPPFPSFEVRAVGNVMNGKYIAGLIIPVTQQAANLGSGAISYIDYARGFFRVGGIPNDPSCVGTAPGGGPTCSGALVQINDPVGRFGLPHSPDPRYTADTGNPTVHATTGYPVCIPRVAPSAVDPLCPLGNRPLNGDPRFPTDPFLPTGAPLKRFNMPAPVNGQFPDARQQAPLRVGDWVSYSGTLFKIDAAGPNVPANMYISAHTLNAALGIFTAAGTPPAYVAVEEALIGVAGEPIPGILQEATTRLFVVGFTTDPTRFVDIFAVDVNPCNGQETLRLLATTDPATQAVTGRFVHHVLGGFFGAPTRDMVVQSRSGVLRNVANGLDAGQYRLPVFEFVFPENHRIGDPIIPNNFEDFPFLAQGSGPLFGSGPVVGQLDPWPGDPAPPRANCVPGGVAPIVSAGADFSVGSLVPVQLAGTMTLDTHSVGAQIVWTQTGGPGVPLSGFNTLSPQFTAPSIPPGGAAQQLTFQLKVTDQFGTGTDSVTVTVQSQTDFVSITAATWTLTTGGRAGFTGKLTVTAISNNPGAFLNIEEVLASNGTNRPLGGMAPISPPGTFTFSATGIPKPARLTVRSAGGAFDTATCGAQDVRGRVICQ
jgi:hypothetical protein